MESIGWARLPIRADHCLLIISNSSSSYLYQLTLLLLLLYTKIKLHSTLATRYSTSNHHALLRRFDYRGPSSPLQSPRYDHKPAVYRRHLKVTYNGVHIQISSRRCSSFACPADFRFRLDLSSVCLYGQMDSTPISHRHKSKLPCISNA